MLPVTTGFIFPNGAMLETDGTGHRKNASIYIRESGLMEKYKQYVEKTSGGEDEYLIEVLGAVKVCHYCGTHYLYVPRLHGDYIDYIVKKYEQAGYSIKYFNTCIGLHVNVPTKSKIINKGYNQTIVTLIGLDGKKYYAYNPNREGD